MNTTFKFGDKVNVPNTSHPRLVTGILSKNRILVIDLVEITPEQKAAWTQKPPKGKFHFVPGMAVDARLCSHWHETQYQKP